MNKFKSGLVLMATLILVACGGNNDVPGKPQFTAQVSFGDSLSDVGSYRLAAIGSTPTNYVGQFTINAAPGTPTNWTEFTSLSLGLGLPCAALTGGFGVAQTPHAGCLGYGEGGAQVSGTGYGNTGPGGPMTLPVLTQITNYLASAVGNKFTGNEIVYVMAGANDVFVQAGTVVDGPTQLAAVAAMKTAANQLAAAVNTQILANGAKYVVIMNIPDIARTPAATSPSVAGLFDLLTTTFNTQLKADLPDSANVLNVDAYTASKDEVVNPGKYNLTNVTVTACNLASPYNPLGSSLGCNANSLSGPLATVDHYLFADTVHPTPYGHLLFATYVLQAMTNKGWY